MSDKTCARCKVSKDVTEFHKRAKSPDGLHTWCKDCCRQYRHGQKARAREKDSHRRSHMKLNYALTDDEYKAMLAKQGGKCFICKGDPPLLIDHNHDNGTVRGLLCRKCNTGLGFFGESAEMLALALEYVRTDGHQKASE